MSEQARRTGEEHVPCMWFAMCDRTTDLELNHPVLGWTACCDRCAEAVGVTVPPQVKGWRVRVHFTVGEESERTETKAFMHPLKAKCESNVLDSAMRWHRTGRDFRTEVMGPVYDTGWGSGAWTEAFKS